MCKEIMKYIRSLSCVQQFHYQSYIVIEQMAWYLLQIYVYKSIEKTQCYSSKRRRPPDSATLNEKRRTKYSTFLKNMFWFHNNILFLTRGHTIM